MTPSERPETDGREAEGHRPEEHYELPSAVTRDVAEAVEAGDVARLRALVEPRHPADVAELLHQLTREQRERLIELDHRLVRPDTLRHLDPAVRVELVEHAGPDLLAEAVAVLESDDAVALLEPLELSTQLDVLRRIPARARAILEQGLTYPEESAGRLMQRELVAVPAWWSVGAAIDFLRAGNELPERFYDVFIVDPAHRPIGAVPLSRVLRSRRDVRLADIAGEDFHSVGVGANQEEVAYLFRKYGLVSAAVVDEAGRLIGVITVDDVVQVIDEEAEEDMLRLGGVVEDDLYRALLDTARARFSWLAVNLVAAIAAASIISLFQSSIARLVALAVLMPIVASMGGNAGTQTLTVAVRAIATRELTAANALRFIGKELLVGSFNGVLFALLAGTLAAVWFTNLRIGLVLGAAMIVNLAVAGLLGTLVPLGLERMRVDPAVASGVFVTTATDVVGFFSFLGLATLVLL
ncbi:MAG: magnesium transporter [Rhodospirillaceae bacterium]|nr:magnesium transporter [Rhodospirillaceae bacterium]